MIEPPKFYSPEVKAAAAKIWMPGPEQWDRVLDRLEQAHEENVPTGFDSEFYNVDVSEQSCAFRARIHVFSVAWLTDKITARGYRKARGAVLPKEAMFYPRFRKWLTGPYWKVASNSPVDQHAFSNELDAELGGVENVLSFFRWMVPGLQKYGLDFATEFLLGRKPFCTFKQLVTEEYEHTRITLKKVKRCECGNQSCRKRDPLFHERVFTTVETPRTSIKLREIPLEQIIPGHKRHDALVLYAADDAIASAEEKDCLLQRDRPVPYPWKGGPNG